LQWEWADRSPDLSGLADVRRDIALAAARDILRALRGEVPGGAVNRLGR